jgi:hypothetical protein
MGPQDSTILAQAVVKSTQTTAGRTRPANTPPSEAQILKSTAQAIVKSTLFPTRDTTPADTTPPRPHLLGLPAELLNYIVTLAGADHSKSKRSNVVWAGVERRQDREIHKRCAYPESPALARTCVRLAAVALPIYYGQKKFAFTSPTQVVDWLNAKAGRYEKPIVRNVEIHFCLDHSKNMSRKIISQRYSALFLNSIVVEMVLRDQTDKLSVRVKHGSHTNIRLHARTLAAVERSLAARVKKTNKGGIYARHPSDKIAEICRYLSFGRRN